MINPLNRTVEFKDENSENDQLASNYTFGEFDKPPTLYSCENKSINCTEESDTGGYFYKVCKVVLNNSLEC